MQLLQHKCWWCNRYNHDHTKVLVLGKERHECKDVATCNERGIGKAATQVAETPLTETVSAILKKHYVPFPAPTKARMSHSSTVAPHPSGGGCERSSEGCWYTYDSSGHVVEWYRIKSSCLCPVCKEAARRITTGYM